MVGTYQPSYIYTDNSCFINIRYYTTFVHIQTNSASFTFGTNLPTDTYKDVSFYFVSIIKQQFPNNSLAT